MKDEEKEDKRIYILSKEKPVKAVIKLGVPLITEHQAFLICSLTVHRYLFKR